MSENDVKERLGFLLNSLGKKVYLVTETCLQPYGLSPRDFGVLETLSQQNAVNQLSLARLRGIDPAVLVSIVDSLEREGWVRRQTDANDRRNRLIFLTESGKCLVEVAGQALDAAEQKLLATLEPEPREALLSALHQLLGSLE